MLRIVCTLPVDPKRHLGCVDIIDQQTGEVIKTAEQVMRDKAKDQQEELRPCGRETEYMRGGWADKKSCIRCKNCKRWWEEAETENLEGTDGNN